MAAIASDSQTTGKDFQSDGGCQWNFTDSDLMKTFDSVEPNSLQQSQKSPLSAQFTMQEFFPNFKVNPSQNDQPAPVFPQFPDIFDQPIISSLDQNHSLQPISTVAESCNPISEDTLFTTLDSIPTPSMENTNNVIHMSSFDGSESTVIQQSDLSNMVPSLMLESTDLSIVKSSDNASSSFTNKIPPPQQHPYSAKSKPVKPTRPRGRPRKYEFGPIRSHDISLFSNKEVFSRSKSREKTDFCDELENLYFKLDYEYAMSSTFNIFNLPSFTQNIYNNQNSNHDHSTDETAVELESIDQEILKSSSDIPSSASEDSAESVRRIRAFSDDELTLQPSTKRCRKNTVTPEKKDGEYWVKRQKNNESAKRSRDARRFKENQVYLRTKFLERMCAKLARDFQEARKQIEELKQRLVKYENMK